jgi:hypothetical protein
VNAYPERIGDQIGSDLLKTIGVPRALDIALDADLDPMLVFALVVLEGGIDDRGEVARAGSNEERLPRACACEAQEVIDHPSHSGAAPQDASGALVHDRLGGLLADEPCRHRDRIQRGAEFVAEDGHELLVDREGLSQPADLQGELALLAKELDEDVELAPEDAGLHRLVQEVDSACLVAAELTSLVVGLGGDEDDRDVAGGGCRRASPLNDVSTTTVLANLTDGRSRAPLAPLRAHRSGIARG